MPLFIRKHLTMLFNAILINMSNFMAKSLNQIFSLPNQLNFCYQIHSSIRKLELHNRCSDVSIGRRKMPFFLLKHMTTLFMAISINLSNFMAKLLHQTFSLPKQLNLCYQIHFSIRKLILPNICFRRRYRHAVDAFVQVKTVDKVYHCQIN